MSARIAELPFFRPPKLMLHQALLPKTDPGRIPIQRFHDLSRSIADQVRRSVGERIELQLLLYQHIQSVDRFAHIPRSCSNRNSSALEDIEHRPQLLVIDRTSHRDLELSGFDDQLTRFASRRYTTGTIVLDRFFFNRPRHH